MNPIITMALASSAAMRAERRKPEPITHLRYKDLTDEQKTYLEKEIMNSPGLKGYQMAWVVFGPEKAINALLSDDPETLMEDEDFLS